MNTLKQTIQLLKRLGLRNFTKPSFLLLSFCIFVCAFIASSLDYFSIAVKQTLDEDITSFLGAPAVVSNNQAIDETVWQTLNIAPVETLSVVTGVVGKNGHTSVALKAVSAGYPLQGPMIVREKKSEFEANEGPRPGDAWLDSYALNSLRVELGQSINLGRHQLTVTREIITEPDRLTQLQPLLPRVMINMADLPQTGIKTDSGTSEFRYLLSMQTVTVEQLENQLNSLGNSNSSFEILTPTSGQHPFSRISERIDRFLDMVIILVLLLCGSATAALAGHAIREYVMPATVLRCMGVDNLAVGLSILVQLVLLFSVMSMAASVVSWVVQPIAFAQLEPHIQLSQTHFSVASMLYVMAITLTIIFVFVVPKVRILTTVSTTSVLRGSEQPSARFSPLHLLLSGLCIGLLIWRSSDNTQLTLMLSIGAIVTIALAVSLGWLLCKLSGRAYLWFKGPMRITLRSIGRQPKRHRAAIATSTIAIMAIMMTAMLRGSFIDTYHVSRLNYDGNYIFNQLPLAEKDRFTNLISEYGGEVKSSAPVLLAKLVQVNGLSIDEALTSQSDTREELRSPVRLSWSSEVPDNNQLTAGQWPRLNEDQVSVESEVMSDLGLKMGDRLGFQLRDSIYTATITSSREGKPGGSSLMFWFMFAPDALAQYSSDHQVMGGIQIDSNQTELLSAVSQQHPNVLMTELARQIEGIKSTLVAITSSINVILALLVISASTVILASVFIGAHERIKELNLFHTLGLSKVKCLLLIVVEQVYIYIIAASTGIASAYLISFMLFMSIFGLPYNIDFALALTVFLSVIVISSVLGAVIGSSSTSKMSKQLSV